MDIQYSYLGYSLIFLLVWAILFVLRPDFRRRMLIFSLIIAPLGPLSEIWFLKDYWRRGTITGYLISIEDVMFSFAIGGITYSIYKVFFNMSAVESEDQPSRPWLIIAFMVLAMAPSSYLTDLLHVNSIFSSTISLLIIAVLIWVLRPDLFKPSIISGFLVLGLFFLVYKLIQVIFPSADRILVYGLQSNGPAHFRAKY
jgi:hypothetical protein